MTHGRLISFGISSSSRKVSLGFRFPRNSRGSGDFTLTPQSPEGVSLFVRREELADRHGWFLVRQFENEAKAGFIDRIVPVNGTEALRFARELARQEGIFCGASGGAMDLFAGSAPGSHNSQGFLCVPPAASGGHVSGYFK